MVEILWRFDLLLVHLQRYRIAGNAEVRPVNVIATLMQTRGTIAM